MIRFSLILLICLLSPALHAGEIIWPSRAKAGPVKLQQVIGNQPVDLGSFGKCRLLGFKAADGEQSFLAVTPHFKPRNGLPAATVRSWNGSFSVSLVTNNASVLSLRRTPAKKLLGLAIYLTGIIDLSPPEKQLVESFRIQGWDVLVSHTSHHFMKPRVLVVDPRTVVKAARKFARDVDNHLADKAYAVEAVLEYLKVKHPEIRAGKRVLAGGSAGALALPAVAARIGSWDAVVSIGGGANIGMVLAESSLNPLQLLERKEANGKSRWTRSNPKTRQRVADLIYRDITLDPARLAPRLKGTPILMLSAEFDQMVPASAGELLFEAYGKPERWSYPVNHILLFAALHLQSGRVAQWVSGNAKTRKSDR
ncbi:MAG: hypothetical protein ACJASX_002125 [Limisphaerales bacterium]|jgi:hypothetical protein